MLELGPPFVRGSLTDVSGAPAMFGRYPGYRSTLKWLAEFVMKPNPGLNRAGDVCPFLRQAHQRDLIYLVTVRTAESTLEEACEAGRHLADVFRALFAEPARFRTGTLIALFPDVDDEDAHRFIDGGHRALRGSFVEQGLMLGEFHRHSEVGSVRNPDLRVMQSPVPMFAVRAISVHDLQFLDQESSPPVQRSKDLGHYMGHLNDKLSESARRQVLERIALARSEA